MTKKDLEKRLIEVREQEEKERAELKAQGTLPSGLDGPIAKKYRDKIKAIFAEYEKSKED